MRPDLFKRLWMPEKVKCRSCFLLLLPFSVHGSPSVVSATHSTALLSIPLWSCSIGSLRNNSSVPFFPFLSSFRLPLNLFPTPHSPLPSPVHQCYSPVMSDSLQPHTQWPAKLLCPWDSLVKNTGVGCHALLQGIFLTQGSNLCLL